MRNRSIKLSKKVAAIILCATMTCGLLSGCGATEEKTATTDTKVTVEANKDDEKEVSVGSGTGTVEKSETVYVIADANGNVQEITVSDWLKNPEKYQTITDNSNLENIVAIKGGEEFTQTGSDLSFTANGNDVYYRGTVPATTELPVSVAISYTLDGKEITKDELKGATGHLEVHIEYKNNTSYEATIDGEKKDIHVPFLSTTMMLLSSDQVANMKIDNGKLIEHGDNNIVVGYGFPGVNESFGLTDGGVFTDTVDFSADVTDYSPEMMMTFVTSEVFASSSLDKAIDVETVTDSLQEVTNTSFNNFDKLESFDDLEDMVHKLKDDGKKLDDGANKLKDGAKQLSDGTSKLSNGAKELSDGASKLTDGGNALKSGSKELKKGADKLKDGLEQLMGGVKQLGTGSTTVNTGMVEFQKNLKLLADNMAIASKGGSDLSAAMNTASTSAKALAEGAKQVSDGVEQLVALADGSAITEALAKLDATIADNDTKIKQLEAALSQFPAVPGPADPGYEQYMTYTVQLNQLKGANAALTQVKSSFGAQASGVNTENLTKLKAGAKQVSDGAKELSAGLATIAEKQAALKDALAQLAAGSSTLNEKSALLVAGTKSISEGANTLVEKSAAFTPGIKAFIAGSDALADGGLKMGTGAIALYKGTRELYDGAVKLDDGAKKLYDGTVELTDGTAKISKAFNGDLAPLVDTARALKEAAKSYETFTSLPTDGKGTVSFVIKTE